ncbi:adhesion G-protein coupled receptor G2-like, partial [Ruditapes philippinarum]|uniref:adhesion G-protein coupled receptor G2-like n=1 Tax=Ruditapes philippinarum TaxID=129788 RepID=UPI00295A9D6B
NFSQIGNFRIILSVDDLTNNLALLGKSNAQFIQDLVVSEIWQQTGNENNVTIGISLDKTDNIEIKKDELSPVREPGNVEVPDTDTAIYLTKSLLEGKRTKLTFQIYGNTDLFSVISSKFKINSKVAAARLTKNNQPIVDLGNDYVTVVFYTYKKSDNLVCAYWNYSANEDAGGWNTKGCTLVSNEYGRVVCKCNHLTNFAVLIDLEAVDISDTDKLVLGIITKIGLIISIIGLGITILTFLMFKHLRNGRGQQVLINLSVAMLCSSVLFLVGVDRTESYGGCIAVSAMLHYFILVTFLWMLVEGLLQYLRFVKVLGTYIPKFMFKTMIPAWGLPLIPVIIVLAIDYDMYYGGNGYCWLSWKPFLYAFIIPVAVIIFANIIVFFMVMCNLCRRKHKGMVSNQSEKKMAFLHFQAGVSILVILGLTWVFRIPNRVDNTRDCVSITCSPYSTLPGPFFIFLTVHSTEKKQNPDKKGMEKDLLQEIPI